MSTFAFRNSTGPRSISSRPGHGSWLEMEMLKAQCADERKEVSKIDKQILSNVGRSVKSS